MLFPFYNIWINTTVQTNITHLCLPLYKILINVSHTRKGLIFHDNGKLGNCASASWIFTMTQISVSGDETRLTITLSSVTVTTQFFVQYKQGRYCRTWKKMRYTLLELWNVVNDKIWVTSVYLNDTNSGEFFLNVDGKYFQEKFM